MDTFYSLDDKVRHRLPGESRAWWVARGFGARLDSAVEDFPHAVRIEARWSVDRVDWEVSEFTAVRRADGVPVTTISLRELGVDFALRQALHSMQNVVVDQDGNDLAGLGEDLRTYLGVIRSDGPTPQVLSEVASIYLLARALRESPVRLITMGFGGLPERTASHWIKLAREREHLVD